MIKDGVVRVFTSDVGQILCHDNKHLRPALPVLLQAECLALIEIDSGRFGCLV